MEEILIHPDEDREGLDDRPDVLGDKLTPAAKTDPQPRKNAPREKKARRIHFPERLIMSRRAYTLTGFGLVLLLVWTFILGILVGRGLIFDSKTFQALEKRISRQAPTQTLPLAVEKDSPVSETGETRDQPALTFYKSLSEDKVRAEIKRTKPPAAAATSDHSSGNGEAGSGGGDERGQGSRAEPAASPETEPDEAVPDARTGPADMENQDRFAIQIAAVDELARAQKLVESLRTQGFPAYTYSVQSGNQRLFRVRVGPFGSRGQAETVLPGLLERGYKGSFITELAD